MTPGRDDIEDEFLAAARQALRVADGPAALDTLSWWDLLPHLDDAEMRTAAFTLFRAQGRELACSPALGALLAQPYLDATAAAPGTVVATVLRQSPQRGPVRMAVGDVSDRKLLVERPGHGAAIVDVDDVELRPVDLPGRLVLHEVDVDVATWAPSLDEPACREARRRSAFLGRVAIGMEILGATEAAVELAVAHAADRQQFGQPIGRFQAVRHLLAWARTDCMAIEAVAREAVRLDRTAPPTYGEVVKALAGRNGRRGCERALQVLGGIGFTAEHDHHHCHSRVLALDALLGTSAELTHALGERVRATGTTPGFPAAVMLAGDTPVTTSVRSSTKSR